MEVIGPQVPTVATILLMNVWALLPPIGTVARRLFHALWEGEIAITMINVREI